MNLHNARVLVAAAVVATAVSGGRAQQPQPPVFRAGVDLTPIDVTVVTSNGDPVPDLKPSDFTVQINGRERRVLRADWVPLVSPVGTPIAKLPDGYSSNDTDLASGRLILIAVDQPNIRPAGVMRVRGAVETFIDELKPADPLAVVGLGHGAVSTPFTTDRAAAKKALSLMAGQSERGQAFKSIGEVEYWRGLAISSSEAVAIDRGEMATLEGAVVRECRMLPEKYADAFRRNLVTTVAPSPLPNPVPLTSDSDLANCRTRISSDARLVASPEIAAREQTIQALRALLKGLASIEGPKTLVFLSEGFSLSDDPQATDEVGALSAAARTTIYALKLDDQAFDASQQGPTYFGAGRMDMENGPGTIASVSRGEMFNLVGDGKSAVRRLERELSGYYLLGVESEENDTDGKAHPINVKVSRSGALVRARRELAFPGRPRVNPANVTEEIASALNSPLAVPGLQIRAATFVMRDPKTGRLQVLIHADVGSSYTAAQPVTVGYVIFDDSGKTVVNQIGAGRLPTAIGGAPSPLTFSGGATLDPGDYTLKLAIAEGDRVGSVEHRIHAGLLDAGEFKLSELMIGGPADARLILAPTIGYDVRFGIVQGYIEAYGQNAGRLTMRYELAPGLDAPSLFSAVVPGRSEGDDRNVFSYAMPVQDLKPGEYFLRATLSANGNVVRRVARVFRVEPAPVNTTSVAAPAKTVALNVGAEFLAPRFRRETLSRRDTLQRFRSTLPAGAAAAFDEGTAALVLGDDAKAEAGFRKALDTGLAGADSTAPLAYLGATYAAAGKDAEALGIWQAALVDGAGFPQLYEWMTDALLRTGNLDAARSLLEEAVTKWPGETGFARPLAAVYAKAGLGREAVALLDRYLTDHPQDLPALRSGVEWMYQVYQAGMVVRSKADDVRAASIWTDAYTLANGPDSDAVKRWMLAIEK